MLSFNMNKKIHCIFFKYILKVIKITNHIIATVLSVEYVEFLVNEFSWANAVIFLV